MKNPFFAFRALPVVLLLSACGRQSATPPASDPPQTPPLAGVAAPASDAAGPAGLPPCPGFARQESSDGDAQTGTAVVLSDRKAESLAEAYTADLLADGWILKTSLRQDDEQHLLFRQGARFVRVQIGPSENPAGFSRLHLAWGTAAGAPESREAYEPEPETDERGVDAGSVEW